MHHSFLDSLSFLGHAVASSIDRVDEVHVEYDIQNLSQFSRVRLPLLVVYIIQTVH